MKKIENLEAPGHGMCFVAGLGLVAAVIALT